MTQVWTICSFLCSGKFGVCLFPGLLALFTCFSTTSGTMAVLLLLPTKASYTTSATDKFLALLALETSTKSLSCSWAWPLRSASTLLFKVEHLEAPPPNPTAPLRLSCSIDSVSKVPLDSHEELSQLLML